MHGVVTRHYVLEGVGLVGVEPRDAALFERSPQARYPRRLGYPANRTHGGTLVMNRTNRRIRFLVDGTEARHDLDQRRLTGNC